VQCGVGGDDASLEVVQRPGEVDDGPCGRCHPEANFRIEMFDRQVRCVHLDAGATAPAVLRRAGQGDRVAGLAQQIDVVQPSSRLVADRRIRAHHSQRGSGLQ
jgi:hypothetical protein